MPDSTSPFPSQPGSERSRERIAHRNNFDFLRLCFASFVILSHSPEFIDGNRNRELLTRLFHTLSLGEVSVGGFFIMSGYLISKSWARSAGMVDFLRSRVLRIYPGFVVAALFTAFVFGPLGAKYGQYFSQFRLTAFAKSVLTLRVPATPPTRVSNGSLWTIHSEFVCYVMVAFLGICGLAKRKFCAPFILLAVTLLFVRKGVLSAPYNFYGFFFAGASFYHLREHIHFTRKGSILALLVLLPAMRFHEITAWLALCTAGAYLLLGFAFLPVSALQRIARRADVSYGTYLYACPIQCLVIKFCAGISPWLLFLISLPLSIGCGWLSWHVVEKHFLRLKRQSAEAVLRTHVA